MLKLPRVKAAAMQASPRHLSASAMADKPAQISLAFYDDVPGHLRLELDGRSLATAINGWHASIRRTP
ncbi:hypothetical protein EAS61_19225 [Bradyrhizobium zhanjiangense]|uniref:Uncharacterized protein n=1 Tax=Bradyrhizobium zhanjiangense TaxID=1325107 RepID=A0A4Q0QKH5_9BRAD|nr:hypothetical protein [Bradyrhizobium zhanjiangense]RXG94634.1 hypothetical protein EAS61_19225 [Bradyrhizobium zhanjiangense]